MGRVGCVGEEGEGEEGEEGGGLLCGGCFGGGWEGEKVGYVGDG